jgi:hypothetical protein
LAEKLEVLAYGGDRGSGIPLIAASSKGEEENNQGSSGTS